MIIYKILIYQLLLAICYKTAAQNLVPNPSFESHSCCPEFPNQSHTDIECLEIWDVPDRKLICPFAEIGTADYWNTCGALGVHLFPLFTLGPKSGDGFAGLVLKEGVGPNYREYLTIKLEKKMVIGAHYYVEFYVAAHWSAHQIDQIGASFSINKPQLCENEILNLTPQIINTNGIIYASQGWVKISGNFEANDKFEWLTIGNFGSNEEVSSDGTDITNQAYYYIDDVSVKVNCCDDIILIEDEQNLPSRVEAISLIKAGTDVGIPDKSGPVIVKNGQDVTLSAKDVILEAGFETEPGAELTITTEGCNPFSDFPAPNIIFIPNAVSPCDDWCLFVENAVSYELYMETNLFFFESSGVIDQTSQLRCINMPHFSVPTVWAYSIKFYNCEGDETSAVGNVLLLGCTNKKENIYTEGALHVKTNRDSTVKSTDAYLKNTLEIYPNPSNGNITLKYEIQESNNVSISLYDMRGVEIDKVMNNSYQEAGIYTLQTDMNQYSNGIYYYSFSAGDYRVVKKVVLNK